MSYNPPPNPSYYETKSSTPSPEQDVRPAVPTLTAEEVRVLKECNQESFYYRCVPLSVLFSGLAYIGMKNGILQKSVRYGYAPKMFGGIIIGYLGGKFSYHSVCQQKIMRLPNSTLADYLRKRKGLPSYQASMGNEPGFSYEAPLDFQNDHQLTLDERRPDLSEHAEGMDSYNTVKENLSPYTENEEAWKEKKYTSYSDLRKENRREYSTKFYEAHKNTDRSPSSTTSSPPPSFPGGLSFSDSDFRPRSDSLPTSRPEPSPTPKRNKYGDVWDD